MIIYGPDMNLNTIRLMGTYHWYLKERTKHNEAACGFNAQYRNRFPDDVPHKELYLQ